MSIVSGKPIPLTSLAATIDSTVTNAPTGTSHTVTNLIIHEVGSGTANVELYLSDDATSASGDRIESITLGANQTDEFRPVVVRAGRYLIMKSDVSNVNFHGSYTYRDGADI